MTKTSSFDNIAGGMIVSKWLRHRANLITGNELKYRVYNLKRELRIAANRVQELEEKAEIAELDRINAEKQVIYLENRIKEMEKTIHEIQTRVRINTDRRLEGVW